MDKIQIPNYPSNKKITIPNKPIDSLMNSNNKNVKISIIIVLLTISFIVAEKNSNKRDNTDVQYSSMSSVDDFLLKKEQEQAEKEQARERARLEEKLEMERKLGLIENFTWSTAWPGNIAIAKIKFKNDTFGDISNITVVFTCYGESGMPLRTITKFIPIVLKSGETRTIRDINVGFIPEFTTSMDVIIK